MALAEPKTDPELDQQLYADLGPNLGDATPVWADATGLDFPDHWFSPSDDSQLAHIGPAGAPPGAPAGLPATAAPAAAPAADAATAPAPDAAPPVNPADLPPAPSEAYQLPFGIGEVPITPPAPPQTVAEMPDITISTEPPSQAPDVLAAAPAPEPAPLQLPLGLSPVPIDSAARAQYASEQHYRQTLRDYAGHIDQIPDPIERQRAYDELYANGQRRGEQATYEAREAADIKAHNDRLEDMRFKALKDYQESQQKAFEDWQAVQKSTAEKMTQVQADVDRIANTKIDPGGGLNPIQKVAGVLMGIVGGLYQGRMGMANNIGIDALNTVINREIAEQKADLERQLHGAQGKLSLLGQQYAQHGDMYRAEQEMRMAMYKAADQMLAVEQQNYTPMGTTERKIAAYRAGAIAAQQMAGIDLKGKLDKQAIELAEQRRKEQDTASQISERKANAARAYAGATRDYAEAKKLGYETDLLNPATLTNPNYTVPIGQDNPYTGLPIMGKRPIGGKDREAQDQEKAIRAQINTYPHVQDYWEKLQAIGDKIGNAKKSLSESMWKARRGTLESEYDAAKEALTVYLTKELGDKLTQGQLEAQAHRIPDRASVFEARDPAAQVAAAQQDADRDFARDMTQAGIDYVPIIKAAQARRAIARPTPESEADAARSALAANPNDKDAQRALAEAQERMASDVRAQQQRKIDISEARQAPPALAPLPEYDAAKDIAGAGLGTLDPKSVYGKQELASEAAINAAVRDANRSAQHYNALRERFQASDGADHLKGITLPGDVAAANRAHEEQLGSFASELLAARQQAIETQAKAQELLQAQAQRRAWEQRIAAFRRGENPDAQPGPPNSVPLPAPDDPMWTIPPPYSSAPMGLPSAEPSKRRR